MATSRKFYVYTLAHPNGSVFYVGKGRNKRIEHHEQEARRGISSEKCDAIRKIWAEGNQVIKSIVFETDDEAEAYAEERNQISFCGRSSVTNCTNGGGGSKALSAEEDIAQTLCSCRMCRQMPEVAEWLANQRSV